MNFVDIVCLSALHSQRKLLELSASVLWARLLNMNLSTFVVKMFFCNFFKADRRMNELRELNPSLTSLSATSWLEWWRWWRVDTEVKIVKQMPTQTQGRKPTIAIITSKYYEKLAVDSMMEDKTTFVRYKTEGQLWFILVCWDFNSLVEVHCNLGPFCGWWRSVLTVQSPEQ